MRVAIFGAGGVGGYFGARLQQAGHDVLFIARGRHLAALRSGGLRLTSPKGDARLLSVDATDDPEGAGPVDVVLVAVKTWQLDDAVPGIRSLLAPETLVVPSLNGVEAADHLAGVLGTGRVAVGVCRILSLIAEPGHIRHVGAEPYLAFGTRVGGAGPHAHAFRDALIAAGMRSEIPDDIDPVLWHKFLFVVSVGGLNALKNEPVGTIRTVPETRSMLRDAMCEIEAVARARAVALPDDIVETSLRYLDTLPAEGTASLARDIADGKRSELDAWNGAVVRLGRASGVPTPIHELIYTSLLPLELRARGEAAY